MIHKIMSNSVAFMNTFLKVIMIFELCENNFNIQLYVFNLYL